MNIENLAKLRDFLFENRESIKGRFDIGSYFDHKTERQSGIRSRFDNPTEQELQALINEPNCGTSACAVGWAPSVIPVEAIDYIEGVLSYNDYCERVLIDTGTDGWQWMFSGSWENVDNTPEGAAFRIDYFLQDQLNGTDRVSKFEGGICGEPDPNDWTASEEREMVLEYHTVRTQWLVNWSKK